MASISETIQNLIAAIAGIFRPKKGLESLSKDDLIKQKNILERNETKILREIEDLEKKKAQLFEEAKQATSDSLRRAKARQIRDIDQRIRSLHGTLTPLGKRISVLNSLIAQHEMGALPAGASELVDTLRQTDAQAIQEEIDEQLAMDLVQDQKMDAMTETFAAARERDEALYEEDEELLDILAQIESAAAMEASVEEAALLKEQPPAEAESSPATKEGPMEE